MTNDNYLYASEVDPDPPNDKAEKFMDIPKWVLEYCHDGTMQKYDCFEYMVYAVHNEVGCCLQFNRYEDVNVAELRTQIDNHADDKFGHGVLNFFLNTENRDKWN